MKKVLMLILTSILILSMTACGGGSSSTADEESGPAGKNVSILTPVPQLSHKRIKWWRK